MQTAVVSAKGWVVVPKEYRLKYNLKPGTRVQVVDYGGVLSIIPLPEQPVTALRGLLAGGPSLTADLLTERQEERAREEGEIGYGLRSG